MFRYIQGSRFFDSSSTSVMGGVEQPTSEVAAVTNPNAETLTGSTFRTRFVGQGYKQVYTQVLLSEIMLKLPIFICFTLSYP